MAVIKARVATRRRLPSSSRSASCCRSAADITESGHRLSSFEPRHQDQAALHLVERRGALKEIDRQGLTKNAMAKLAPEWASFPTWTGRSAYGQPVKSHQELASFYSSNLRELRNQLGA